MKLYKYRSTARLDHVLDIILNERLYCAPYKELNDPFEGLFASQIRLTAEDQRKFFRLPGILGRPPSSIEIIRSVDNLTMEKAAEWRVCSLSADPSDVRLWSHYADAHRGVTIEIDFTGILDGVVWPVTYSPRLKEFGFTLLSQPHPIEIFSHKTDHWSYEAEHRVILPQDFCYVEGRISAVLCGPRMSPETILLMRKVTPPAIPVFRTKLNQKKLKVERDTAVT